LDAFLQGLPTLLGLDVRRVVLGGFSQGGTTSMAYALRRPDRVAAVLNFSGFLPDGALVPATGAVQRPPPIFWGHGTRDANIPLELAARGRIRLKDAGVPVEAKDYEIGHWIVPDELADAVRMVQASR
jgi:phospholipase/carboxylesterase